MYAALKVAGWLSAAGGVIAAYGFWPVWALSAASIGSGLAGGLVFFALAHIVDVVETIDRNQ